MNKKTKKPLQGNVAVVTGAESGIGRAIAIELGSQGAAVAVNYHQDQMAADETLGLIKKAGGTGAVFPGDVTDHIQVKKFYQQVVAELGTPYILVNSAGINASGIPVIDMEVEIFDRTLKTDLYGTFYHCKEFIIFRKAAGGGGKIVNISSIHESVVFPGAAAYCASKGALGNFTKVLALETAVLQINVNNIGPGMILTAMNQAAIDDPKLRKKKTKHIPLGRAGRPEEVAKLAAYLVSEDAAYATGQTYYLDGGLMINIGQGA